MTTPVAAKTKVSYALQRTKPSAYLRAVCTVAVCAVVDKLIHNFVDHSNLVMVLLLGVAWSAARYGRGPSVLASICSVGIYDFFFVEPLFSMTVENSQYLLTFAVMLTIAILISTLTARVKQQAELANQREQETFALYSLSQDLAQARTVENILKVASAHFRNTFGCEMKALGLDNVNPISPVQTTLQEEQKNFLIRDNQLFFALQGTHGTTAVLELTRSTEPWELENDSELNFLQTFVNQIAMAIEGCQMANQAEFEKLRNTLLSSVSHDVRTPLATITGAASSLLDSKAMNALPREHELATAILEESQRLDAYVRNILSMTRLQAGAIEMTKEVQPLEEVIGAALTRLEEPLSERIVATKLSEDLPLVSVDAVMMEQVFVNLLDNALKYTKNGDRIVVEATEDEKGNVLVCVSDNGRGIKQGEEAKIFEKFFRSSDTDSSTFGAGLGLAICRGIVEAHGGRIWAEQGTPDGARFCFTLPAQKSYFPSDGTTNA